MTSPRFALPLLCGLLACLSWSIGSVLSKIALSSVEPLTLLAGQLAVSSLSLSALSIWLGAPIRLGDLRVGLPGLLQPALAYSLSTYGLTMVPATAEAMLFALETPIIILLAWPILGEPVTLRQVVGGIIILAGIALAAMRRIAETLRCHMCWSLRCLTFGRHVGDWALIHPQITQTSPIQNTRTSAGRAGCGPSPLVSRGREAGAVGPLRGRPASVTPPESRRAVRIRSSAASASSADRCGVHAAYRSATARTSESMRSSEARSMRRPP